MRWILVFFAIFTFSGCERIIEKTEYLCGKTTRDKKAEFILSCIKNANPASEEEPEDWITLCEDMAVRTYCTEIKGFKVWGFNPSAFRPCTQATTKEEKRACR